MQVVLYFEKLDLYSGVGQLLKMQVAGLRAQGARATLAAGRGGLRYFLRTGIPVRRRTADQAAALAAADTLVVDHNLAIPDADVAFVHNLATEAARFGAPPDDARAMAEHRFFAGLAPHTQLVANSALVAAALGARFGVEPERVCIQRPGHDALRFDPGLRPALRAAARRALGVPVGAPLVGLVTSGNFAKRGLDLFVAAAERIAARSPATRFLVVGARALPDEVAAHALVAGGKLVYRPKNHHPERWLAALDVFVYPARFEEFGMVVLEAAALGVPVLTTRRVGAAECLPAEYEPWLGDAPDADALAERALTLLADSAARERLAAAGAAAACAYTDGRYAAATAATILAQKRRPK